MNSFKETRGSWGYFSKSQCVFTADFPPLSQHDVSSSTDYIHLYRWITSLFSTSRTSACTHRPDGQFPQNLCFLLSHICFNVSLSCSTGIFSKTAGGTNRVSLSCIFVSLSIWTVACVFFYTASVCAFFYFSLCSCGESSACRLRPCFSYLIKCSTAAGCEHAEWLSHREMLSRSRRCFQRQPLVLTWVVRLHAAKQLTVVEDSAWSLPGKTS